jgi:hypothetical protein
MFIPGLHLERAGDIVTSSSLCDISLLFSLHCLHQNPSSKESFLGPLPLPWSEQLFTRQTHPQGMAKNPDNWDNEQASLFVPSPRRGTRVFQVLSMCMSPPWCSTVLLRASSGVRKTWVCSLAPS